jgi:hypothetical protein
VKNEVRASLNKLADTCIKKLAQDIDNWEEKPTFTKKVIVKPGEWAFEIHIKGNKKTKRLYGWVNEGVGVYGGKAALPDILPKRRNKTKTLGFSVPHQPKSLPNPAVAGIPSNDTPHFLRAKKVRHPGIYPRRFTETLTLWLKSRAPGAFRSVVEAAVKRGFRK